MHRISILVALVTSGQAPDSLVSTDLRRLGTGFDMTWYVAHDGFMVNILRSKTIDPRSGSCTYPQITLELSLYSAVLIYTSGYWLQGIFC